MINKSTFLIAEIGINHNGDINISKELIDNAAACGFDAVKFQKRTIDIVYSQNDLEKLRESPWGTTQREQKEGLEFSENEYDIIDSYCKEKKITWFASAWDVKSLEFLDRYNLKYNKIASAMIVDKKFLTEVAKRKQHTFISTGMSTLKDIENAVDIFKEHKASFELMHCVSTYPAKAEDINLNTIPALKKKFQCNVGYSGHENGTAISLAAFMYGISSLERHITLDRTMYGSDQAASIELKGMKNLAESIEKIKKSCGTNNIGHVTKEEMAIAEKLRAHIKL
ncbi:N-acetylneuraminate synthase family protein [Candidatus Pelagibacter sp.]|jgi:N-acetylneuraminate synthase|nr:N-acetylneuraminate synthase family protein [Candidatus Pelagibacter sp.]|tara:strand:+ start:2651 stop:3499 length:849 start_codon:yes stop_codon:yes gene_type:complete